MKNLQLFSALLLFASGTVSAQTTITSNIYSSTAWTASGSPYTIANNIVVFSGTVLTIEPGVTVKFNDSVTVDFRGQLIANGSSSARITFTSADSIPMPGAYGGFKVTGYCGSSGSIDSQVTMSYCDIYYAQDFMDLAASCEGPFNFTNCSFRNNIYAEGHSSDFQNVTFDSCSFIGNYEGIVWDDGGYSVYANNCTFINDTFGTNAVHVNNCYFSGCTGWAVYADEGNSTILNCEICNGNVGAEWVGFSGTAFTNNYIHDNQVGLMLGGLWEGPSTPFNDNRICHNSEWNIEYTNTNNADVSDNCFCSGDSAYIRSTLRDGYVDATFGLLTFNIDTFCYVGPLVVQTITSAATGVKLYPDPLYDQAALEFNYSNGHVYQLEIIDQLGRRVSNVDGIISGSVTIKKNNMAPGLYYYKLRDERQLINTGKFVVE